MRLVMDVGAHPAQVGQARRIVAEHLVEWGLDGDTRDVAVLLVSELVTNALQHGRQPMRLVADNGPDTLRVEIYDGGDGRPAIRPVRADEPGGRGLRLVDALATRWETTLGPDGKCVWFELDTKGAEHERA